MASEPQFLNNEQLLSVLSTTSSAMAIHVFENATIQFANEAMLKIWDKGRGVIGLSLEEALPELKGQPFIDMFKRVWNEGITISGRDAPAQLKVDGELKTFYFDFEYRAVLNPDGKTYCILHTANDVTERYLTASREQDLTEELTAANEELSASNEALFSANAELTHSQKHLQELYENLADSDRRFRSMVRQAPVGMCIINAADLFIQEVNDSYLELVGKKREEFDKKTIWEAVPEAADLYAPVMNGVIDSGTAFFAKEHEVVLVRNGVPETVFLDFVYEPMKQGEVVTAIMVIVIDVTDKVISRRSIEDMEERARMAVEAAEMGTFDSNLINNTILASPRFFAIFGFEHTVSWKELISVFHPDDLKIREAALADAYKNGKLAYEARVVYADNSIHWMRVQGYVYYDGDGLPYRMLGTVIDITEFKRLQQQKDDFISIASHELKTPITSLKASLQLLERMKHDPSSTMFPKLIEQSAKSMQKISALVDDLLNVSRTNEREIQLKKSVFPISEIIEDCQNHITVSGRYSLVVDGDAAIEINADERAIEQVVVNLINNAVKYAPDSLEIRLGIEKQEEFVKISIRDHGPGIPPDKIPHLFERYYQAQAAGFNNSGLGLGLFISAEIIKRHGGRIGVYSKLGEGSTFWFTLPA